MPFFPAKFHREPKILIQHLLSLSLYEQVLQAYLMKRNITVHGSLAWLSHQVCDDMFMSSKWNGSTTYGFGNNERDFGTDYGICCW